MLSTKLDFLPPGFSAALSLHAFVVSLAHAFLGGGFFGAPSISWVPYRLAEVFKQVYG